jgi:ATP-dependent Clp protease ATP-binding subunit ClpA
VCVEAAIEEARMLGHDSIGDEDLLLGILHTDEGLAAEVLSSQGVRLEAAREECERMASDALSSVGISLKTYAGRRATLSTCGYRRAVASRSLHGRRVRWRGRSGRR